MRTVDRQLLRRAGRTDGGTSLLVTPAQHRADDIEAGTSTRRQYSNLDLRLYYSGNRARLALSDAPTIVSVDAQLDGGGVVFTAQVVGDPAAAIHQVWITYTADGLGAWTSLRRTSSSVCAPRPARRSRPCARSRIRGYGWDSLPRRPPVCKYVVQAASGTGLVTLDDNRGQYYTLSGGTPPNSTLALLRQSAGSAQLRRQRSGHCGARSREPGCEQDGARCDRQRGTRRNDRFERERHRQRAGDGRPRKLPDHRVLCR